jgi:hypothetical protein
MSCILYKNGKQERVKAEYVEHMLRHGYSDSPTAKPEKPKTDKSLQDDLALSEVVKPAPKNSIKKKASDK